MEEEIKQQAVGENNILKVEDEDKGNVHDEYREKLSEGPLDSSEDEAGTTTKTVGPSPIDAIAATRELWQATVVYVLGTFARLLRTLL